MRKLFAGCLAIIAIIPVAAIAALAFFAADLLEQIAMYALYGCVGLAVLAVFVVANVAYSRRERRERTYIDGALPVMRRRRHIWRSDIPTPLAVWSLLVGEEFYIDPNRMMAPAWSFDAFGRVAQVEPVGGWAAQHAYNLAVEHTNTVRAIAQGDDSRNHLFGRDSMPVRLPARALTPRVERPQLPGPVDEVDGEFRPALPATLADALTQHRGPEVLLGQNKNGEPALWNPQLDPHLGVWGKSGAGKTTHAGLTIAIGQARQNWRVLIIDPEQEGDHPTGHWGTLASWAQVVGPGEPGCSLWEQIMRWYESRWRNIQDAGATDAYHMPSGTPLRPLAIHFDELARWREKGRRQGGTWAKYVCQVDDCLAEIGQRGRKRGVHLTVYGQLPGDLPESIAGNLSNLTFKQAENQGNKVGYWAAHQLREGEFAYGGTVYSSFFPLLEAPQILGNRTPPPALLTGDATVGVRSGEGEGVSVGHRSVETERPNDRTIVYDSTNLQKSVWDWRSVNPNGTQAEMRAAFENQGIKIARGYAHECWHKWPGISLAEQLMAQGIDLAKVRLPGGERLGVDITHNGVS